MAHYREGAKKTNKGAINQNRKSDNGDALMDNLPPFIKESKSLHNLQDKNLFNSIKSLHHVNFYSSIPLLHLSCAEKSAKSLWPG